MHLFITLLIVLFSQQTFAQNCNARVLNDTPTTRYIIATDGTVLDKQTGLIWMRCTVGQKWDGISCNGSRSFMLWQTALQTAKNNNFAGKNDWRLPNKKELHSLVGSRCSYPVNNTVIFPGATSDEFWSSSPYARNSSYAWSIDFNNGYDRGSSKDNLYAIRLVRGGR